jgi:hypothetical protein
MKEEEKRERKAPRRRTRREERKILIPLKMSLCLWYTN